MPVIQKITDIDNSREFYEISIPNVSGYSSLAIWIYKRITSEEARKRFVFIRLEADGKMSRTLNKINSAKNIETEIEAFCPDRIFFGDDKTITALYLTNQNQSKKRPPTAVKVCQAFVKTDSLSVESLIKSSASNINLLYKGAFLGADSAENFVDSLVSLVKHDALSIHHFEYINKNIYQQTKKIKSLFYFPERDNLLKLINGEDCANIFFFQCNKNNYNIYFYFYLKPFDHSTDIVIYIKKIAPDKEKSIKRRILNKVIENQSNNNNWFYLTIFDDFADKVSTNAKSFFDVMQKCKKNEGVDIQSQYVSIQAASEELQGHLDEKIFILEQTNNPSHPFNVDRIKPRTFSCFSKNIALNCAVNTLIHRAQHIADKRNGLSDFGVDKTAVFCLLAFPSSQWNVDLANRAQMEKACDILDYMVQYYNNSCADEERKLSFNRVEIMDNIWTNYRFPYELAALNMAISCYSISNGAKLSDKSSIKINEASINKNSKNWQEEVDSAEISVIDSTGHEQRIENVFTNSDFAKKVILALSQIKSVQINISKEDDKAPQFTFTPIKSLFAPYCLADSFYNVRLSQRLIPTHDTYVNYNTSNSEIFVTAKVFRTLFYHYDYSNVLNLRKTDSFSLTRTHKASDNTFLQYLLPDKVFNSRTSLYNFIAKFSNNKNLNTKFITVTDTKRVYANGRTDYILSTPISAINLMDIIEDYKPTYIFITSSVNGCPVYIGIALNDGVIEIGSPNENKLSQEYIERNLLQLC